MRKVRIYQLARELRISSDALLNLVQEVDPSVTSHMAAVDAAVAEKVREQMAETKSQVKREAAQRARIQGGLRQPGTATVSPRRRAAAEKKTPEEEAVPAWGISSLPKAPEVAVPVLEAGSAVAAPPPARRVGPAVAVPGHPNVSSPFGQEAAPESPTRTYRPEAPRGRGARGRAPVPERRVGRKGRKKKRRQADEREVADSVRRTMATIDAGRQRHRRRRQAGEDGAGDEETLKIRVSEFVTVAELASTLQIRPAEVVGACLRLGIVANVNRRLDRDSIEAVADEFDCDVEIVKEIGEEILDQVEEEAGAAAELPRPAIVTVMGHVDHGKTKLLDCIRETDVVSREAGGITQHIGASTVRLKGGNRLTFLDTPGHEAFTAMRARGADVTDIVILVVAADDRVNEQTIEAINHAKAARKPIVVAINKVDLANADPERIKKELADQGLLLEEWGGDVVAVEVSAKVGTNVDKLLEMVLLVAEMLELKAQGDRPARATVIEAKVEPGRGIVGSVLIQSGTLKIGDAFVCGIVHGKVRAMISAVGERIESAGPSTPVEVLGWSALPQVADNFAALRSEAESRLIAGRRTEAAREHRMKLAANRFRLDNLYERIKESERADLRVIIKGDVQGSVEVLRDSLEKLSNEQVSIVVIHAGAGKINESDVLLAAASNAIIIGFHVRPDPRATQLAQSEKVEIRLYEVIYEVVEHIEAAMAGLLKPKEEERVLGSAEVRETFAIPKVGTVAGCRVVGGVMSRQAMARVIRGEDVIWSGKVASLKRFKEDVKEVATGYDCGIVLDGFDEVKVGDLVEAYVIEEVAAGKA